MNDDNFNMSIRKFLKTVGVRSQHEIEKAVAAGMAVGKVKGSEKYPATMTLKVEGPSGTTTLHVAAGLSGHYALQYDAAKAAGKYSVTATAPDGPPSEIHAVERGWGRFGFHRARWEEMPTQYPIVNALAALPLSDFSPALRVRSSGGGDSSGQRILA